MSSPRPPAFLPPGERLLRTAPKRTEWNREHRLRTAGDILLGAWFTNPLSKVWKCGFLLSTRTENGQSNVVNKHGDEPKDQVTRLLQPADVTDGQMSLGD